MKNVKVLIFDLDNTLINYGGVTRWAWEISIHKAMSLPSCKAEKKEFHSFLEKEFIKQKELALTIETGMFTAKK